jgi:SnoaL-like domain
MKKYLPMIVAMGSLMFAGAAGAAGTLSALDYAEIQQLYARYNIAIDTGDAEGWAATFIPEGVFNTFSGHDALVGFVKMWREKLNGATRKHWNTNLEVTGDGKQATGSVYLMLLDTSTKPVGIIFTGIYHDSLIKTKDGWRFAKRLNTPDTPAATESK